MEQMKTVEILRNLDRATLDDLIGALNSDHMVSDEDNKGLSSVMIEGWSKDCEDYLRENGYSCGKLTTHGGYFPLHGAVYVVFDESQVSYGDASVYLSEVASRDN